jgi:transcription elongation factor GreA
MNHSYISRSGLEKLQRELRELKSVKRHEVAKRLQEATELGDLSENSEYLAAREAQETLERRIAELEDAVKEGVVIEEEIGVAGVVRVGSKVEVEQNGNKTTYTIVGSREARPQEGKISNESPLGGALLGKRAGDTITVDTPGGAKKIAILGIT